MRNKIEFLIWNTHNGREPISINDATDAIMAIIEEEKKAATCETIEKIAKGLASGRTLK